MAKHPGRILADDFLEPLGVSGNRLAVGLGVHRSAISRLLAGRQPVTLPMAARLGAFFGVPARWWLLMQAEYDAAVIDASPHLVAGVSPLLPLPNVLLTPRGVIRLANPAAETPGPITLHLHELDEPGPRLPPTPERDVRVVEFQGGAVALVGVEE